MNALRCWLNQISKSLGFTVRQGQVASAQPAPPADEEDEVDFMTAPAWQPLGGFCEKDVLPLLKDCPHCCNKDEVELLAFMDGEPTCWVHCYCGTSGPTCYTPAEAFRTWNALPRRGDP